MPDVHGYLREEVAAHFQVTGEAVRLAGIRGDLTAVKVDVGRGRPQWRYPQDAIDEMEAWPSRRPGPRRTRADEVGLTRELRREVAELRTDLDRERLGRALAEQRITALGQELERFRAALLAFVAEPVHPDEAPAT